MTTTAAAKIDSLHTTLVAAEAAASWQDWNIGSKSHPVNVAYRAWKRAVNRAERTGR